jgi:membrane-associated phospholipid phosphatase
MRRAAKSRQAEQIERWALPALAPRPGGPAERFAGRIGLRHPAAVFFAALFAGLALLFAGSILLGLLVTDVLLHAGGVARTDESAIRSLVADRTPFLTDLSAVGSAVGGAPVLPILVGLLGLACAALRRWRLAAFAVFVLAVESATYRVTSLAVPRDRPHVARLEDLPADASYPSGHTAASIAVYAGLVYLLTSGISNRRARIAAWAVAVLLPVFVALSRMYRGMHHPIDVAAGLLIGIGAVVVLLFACRAAGAVTGGPARAGARAARRGSVRAAA